MPANDAYAPLAALTTLAFLAALSPLPIVKRALLAGLAIGAAGTVKQTAALRGRRAAGDFAARAGRRAAQDPGDGGFLRSPRPPRLWAFSSISPVTARAGPLIDDTVLLALRRPASDSEGLSFAAGVMRYLPLQRSLMPIFGLACLALMRRSALARAAPGVAFGALGLWFALASLCPCSIQRAIAENYLGPTLAPGLLLAGALVVFAPPALARHRAGGSPWRWWGSRPSRRRSTFAPAKSRRELKAPQETRAIAAGRRGDPRERADAGDKLFVVNRGGWLYTATNLPPPTAYFFPGHTLCDFPGAAYRLAEALATQPRYIVVADRRIRYVCEQADRWSIVDAVLARSYRLLAHAAGEGDSYDVYEAVGRTAPAL